MVSHGRLPVLRRAVRIRWRDIGLRDPRVDALDPGLPRASARHLRRDAGDRGADGEPRRAGGGARVRGEPGARAPRARASARAHGTLPRAVHFLARSSSLHAGMGRGPAGRCRGGDRQDEKGADLFRESRRPRHVRLPSLGAHRSAPHPGRDGRGPADRPRRPRPLPDATRLLSPGRAASAGG